MLCPWGVLLSGSCRVLAAELSLSCCAPLWVQEKPLRGPTWSPTYSILGCKLLPVQGFWTGPALPSSSETPALPPCLTSPWGHIQTYLAVQG